MSERFGEFLVQGLSRRQRQLNRIYKCGCGGGASSMALDTLVSPSLDLGAMSASAIICTGTPDREMESINPKGGDYEHYRTNPIVLWEHGFESNVPTAIAKCEHPDGSLALEVFDDRIEATSYFTNRNLVSEQIYNLIEDGIVRATSIHIDPVKDSMRMQIIDGKKILVMDRWKMLEWSWTNMGVNPEAVRKTLSRNRLAGRPIEASIAKSLRPFAAKPRRLVNGTSLKSCGTVCDKSRAKDIDALQNSDGSMQNISVAGSWSGKRQGSITKMFDPAKLSAMSDEELQAARDAASPDEARLIDEEIGNRSGVTKTDDEADTDALSESDFTEGDDAAAETETDEMSDAAMPDAATTGELPLGATILSSTTSSIQGLLQQVAASMGPLENEAVKQYLETLTQTLENVVSEIEGLYGQQYAQFGALAGGDGSPEDVDQEVLKSWLAGARVRHLRVSGLARQVAAIGTRSKSTGDGRRLISLAKSLDAMIAEAKGTKAKSIPAKKEPSAVQDIERIKQLEQQLGELQSLFAKVLPASRTA